MTRRVATRLANLPPNAIRQVSSFLANSNIVRASAASRNTAEAFAPELHDRRRTYSTVRNDIENILRACENVIFERNVFDTQVGTQTGAFVHDAPDFVKSRFREVYSIHITQYICRLAQSRRWLHVVTLLDRTTGVPLVKAQWSDAQPVAAYYLSSLPEQTRRAVRHALTRIGMPGATGRDDLSVLP